MSGEPANAVDVADAARRASQLGSLREQRRRLADLREDLVTAVRQVPDDDLGGTWRSPAQRGYARRRGELLDTVSQAGRRLDDAIDALTMAIARVS